MLSEKQEKTPEEIEFWSRYGIWPKPEQLKSKHGGKRQGSGRPSKLLNPKRVTIWLEAEQLEWINSQGDKSEIIRNLINKSKAP